MNFAIASSRLAPDMLEPGRYVVGQPVSRLEDPVLPRSSAFTIVSVFQMEIWRGCDCPGLCGYGSGHLRCIPAAATDRLKVLQA